MIGIKLSSGEFLTLPPNTSLRMVLQSSIFFDEEGSYSFPFNIPIEGNAEKLGFPEAIQKVGSVKQFDVSVCLYNNIWKTAKLKIRKIVFTNYECYVKVEGSVLATDIQNKKITSLDLGGDREVRIPNLYRSIKLLGSGTTGSVTVQFNSLPKTVPFNTDIPTTMADLAAAFMADPSGLAANFMSLVTSSGSHIRAFSDDDTPVFPSYIEPPFGSDPGPGRSFDSDVDTVGCGVIVDHMNEAAAGTIDDFDYTFYPIKNPGFYSDNSDYMGYINYYHNGSFAGNWYEGTTGLKHSITPFPYMLYVFKKCFEEFGLKPTGSFLEDEEIKKVTIYNNYAMDRLLINDGTGLPYANSWTNKINLQNHVPDVSIGDFIKAVKAKFNLAFFYFPEKGEVEIKYINDILLDPKYEDWTSIAEPATEEESNESDGFILTPDQDSNDDAISERIKSLKGLTIKDAVDEVSDLPNTSPPNEDGDIRLVSFLNVYYKVARLYDVSTGSYTWSWQEYSENQGDYTIGNGKEKIDLRSSACSTLRFETAVDPDKKWTVPYVDQPGTSAEFGQGINSFGVRFLFYRGIQPGYEPGGSAMTYPLATPYNLDYDNTVLGPYSFASDQSYQLFYRRWLNFKASYRPIKMNIRLDAARLMTLDYTLIKRVNGVNYLLSYVDVTNTMRGPRVSSAYLYKL
jgi:hypothetical protein